jgi:hypothetical protein
VKYFDWDSFATNPSGSLTNAQKILLAIRLPVRSEKASELMLALRLATNWRNIAENRFIWQPNFSGIQHPKSHLREVHSSRTDDDAPIDLARKIFHRYHRYCWRPVVWISFVESNALGVRIISPQNMDKTELVTLVSSKTGLNEQMATLAVDTVIGFLKQKLPAELSGQLDSLLSGQESSGGMLGAVKGLFGRKDS